MSYRFTYVYADIVNDIVSGNDPDGSSQPRLPPTGLQPADPRQSSPFKLIQISLVATTGYIGCNLIYQVTYPITIVIYCCLHLPLHL